MVGGVVEEVVEEWVRGEEGDRAVNLVLAPDALQDDLLLGLSAVCLVLAIPFLIFSLLLISSCLPVLHHA